MYLRVLSIFLTLFSIHTLTYAADITGNWKIVDDKSGAAFVKVKITKLPNKTYEGRIIDLLNTDGTKATEFSNSLVLSNLKEDLKRPGYFLDGIILNPAKNETYRNINGKLNTKGSVMILRGKLENGSLSRRMSWVRIE